MPRVSIDLTEAQSNKPIPDGVYPVRVDEFSDVQTGPKAQYITATLTVSEGEHEGRKFFVNLPIAGKGAGILADFVSKCTGEDIDVDQLSEMDLDTDDLIGSELAVSTKQEEYPLGSGEMRASVKKVMAAR